MHTALEHTDRKPMWLHGEGRAGRAKWFWLKLQAKIFLIWCPQGLASAKVSGTILGPQQSFANVHNCHLYAEEGCFTSEWKPAMFTFPKRVMVTAYLITVQCVLRCPRGNWNGIWLAAAITLAIQVFSIPGDTKKLLIADTAGVFFPRLVKVFCDSMEK